MSVANLGAQHGTPDTCHEQCDSCAMFGAFLVGLAASASRPVLEALSSGARRRLIASPGGGLQLGEEIVQPPKEGWFDGATVGACTVRRMGGAEPKWCMWYAGRSVGFASDVMPIATGCVGVAVSHDGITWEQACGEGAAGECFGPDGAENGAFDAAHVGVGDVVDGARRMLYFGGGSAPTDLGGRSVRGVAMGIGMATSTDGVRWERSFGGKALLLPRAGEQMFLGWPCAHREYVYYHASDVASYGGKFAIARARVTRTEAAAAAAEGELGSFSDLEAEEQYVLVPGEPGTFDGARARLEEHSASLCAK